MSASTENTLRKIFRWPRRAVTSESGRRRGAMPELAARMATRRDVPALLAMMQEFNELEAVPWNLDAKKRALERLLGSVELGVVMLLDSAEETVGYFVLTWGYDLEWDGRDAFLTELFLRAASRGQGLGRSALELMDEVARVHGARALHLMVREENTRARRLYTGHGYRSPPRIFMSREL